MPIEPPAIIQPAPARAAVSGPATSTLVAGLFGDDDRTVIGSGPSSELDLGSMLDSVPTDPGGKKGAQPSPATHVIFDIIGNRGAQSLSHALFGVKNTVGNT